MVTAVVGANWGDEGFVIMGMKYFLLNANSLEY